MQKLRSRIYRRSSCRRSSKEASVSRRSCSASGSVFQGNCRFTISALSESFPEILRSALYATVSGEFQYRKLFAGWFPKMLFGRHTRQRINSALEFLQLYLNEGEDILNNIFTGDETWVHYKIKQQENNPKIACIFIWLLYWGKWDSLGGIHATWHDHHCNLIECNFSTSAKNNSEQAKINFVIRNFSSSWQCLGAHCSCSK